MKKPTTIQEVENRLNYFKQNAKRKVYGNMHSQLSPGLYMVRKVDEYDSDKFYLDGTYSINPKTLKVSINGNLWLGGLTDTELGIEFEKITGNFRVVNCPNLNTLKGFPTKVRDCTSIENCPSLISLDYFPIKSNEIYIRNCPITSISQISRNVKDLHISNVNITDFSTLDCSSLTKIQNLGVDSCHNMISLRGLEDLVLNKKSTRNQFSGKCSYVSEISISHLNKLTSLEHLPSEVTGNLLIGYMPILNLEHVSSVVRGTLTLRGLDLVTDLKYISRELGGIDASWDMTNLMDITELSKIVIYNRIDLNSNIFPRKVIKNIVPNFTGVIGRN